MKAARRIIISVLLLLCAAGLKAQNLTDLRIGEVLVDNETGLVDSFGERNGWIEIFNTSSGSVRFSGCYISDDKNNLKKYHIPTTDRSTTLGPRQSVVFYASGKSFQGTYHTNFTLEKGETVYLVSNDGKTILDEVRIPVDLPADNSVKNVPCGVKKIDMETTLSDQPTPGSYNGDVDAKSNSEIMKEKDPHGFVLTLIAVSTVFSALFILSIIFSLVGKASQKALDKGNGKGKEKKKKEKKGKAAAGEMSPEVAAAISLALQQEFGGEVYAAIAMALDDYLGSSMHDAESFIITIKPTQGSTWADKSQTFRQSPRK